MKKNPLLLLGGAFCISLCNLLNAQEYRGAKAEAVIPGSKYIWYNSTTEKPSFICFSNTGLKRLNGNLNATVKTILNLKPEEDLKEYTSETDYVNFTHIRYQQLYKGIPVEGGTYIAHLRGGSIESLNGAVYETGEIDVSPALSEKDALNTALTFVGAEKYKWENTEEITQLREIFNNPYFNYDPRGELVIYPVKGEYKLGAQFRLAYKFNIYAEEPESRADYFVDAKNGEILGKHDQIHSADKPGTAVSGYSGTITITTDEVSSTSYRLRETGRGMGIETWNAQKGNTTGNAVDFTDTDNNWNNTNTNLDQYATDAHYATEMMYDYLLIKFNRNSIDNNGFKLLNYVHWNNNWYNASWNGTSMRYGDGNGKPLTSLDVGAHEMAHGLTSNSAKLVYQNESGALNESFSDIFGNTIERYARPNKYNWLMGEDFGSLRNMKNPNQYNNPDTYKGQQWESGTADNGGVHDNSGVQNFWYYLLSDGGTGTNDNGAAYNVTAIGIDKAAAIAFRNLTVYLTSNSQYADARTYAIKAATDLFGACSQETISTTDAWHAVGIGAKFDPSTCSNTPLANFIADITSTCKGDVVFTDQSSFNPTSWAWDFGDGGTSSLQNPTHSYASNGTFTVKLVSSNVYGSDSTAKTSFITVNKPADPTVLDGTRCGSGIVNLSATGTNTLEWYDAASGGILVNTGPSYSPVISATTTYFVSNNLTYPVQKVGEPDNTKAGGYLTSPDRRLIFDAFTDVIIKSVVVYANTAGSRVIEVVNSSGTTISTTTVNVAAGMSRITLNLNVPKGIDHALKVATGSTADLYRNNAGGLGFPYAINNLVSIKTTDAGTNPTNYYYYFYDWEVTQAPCLSNRVPVTGTVQMCTGIAGNNKSQAINIHPNPTTGQLTIDMPANGTGEASIQVVNIIGEVVYATYAENNKGMFTKTLDLSGMTAGVYFISVTNGNNKTIRKIIRE